MAVTTVQAKAAATASAASVAAAFDSNVTAGSCLVVIGFLEDTVKTLSVADTQTNSYTVGMGPIDEGDDGFTSGGTTNTGGFRRLALASTFSAPLSRVSIRPRRAVMALLLSLVRGAGTTLLFVTHSREFAALADETWELHSGRLELP